MTRNVSVLARSTVLACALLCLAVGGLQAQTYDMLDYMMNNDTNKAILFTTNDNQTQVIRTYFAPGTSDRFYITKNYDGTGATDYEEYTFDNNYIYLVRDTSWQPSNWCSGQQTMFELWTGNRNRGVRFPRYVQHNQLITVPGSVIKARLEGNCAYCNGPTDSDGQTVAATYRFTKLGSKHFAATGQTLYDLIKVTVEDGAGTGESYYFSKTLGWVGYEDGNQTSYYSGYANNGNNFQVQAKDACTGVSGCTWYHANSSNIYHQIGEPDGYDWSANTVEHNSGFLTYGPYESKWGTGSHYAQFLLSIDNNWADNAVVATVDVVTAGGTRVLASRNIRRQEFSSPNSWQWFTIWFSYPSFEQVEARVYWHDNSYLKHGQSYICKP